MENNLDDILIDPLEEKQKNPKSKRWVLISVALVLLIAVVAIVLYFVFVKEEAKGLETIHTELERFEANTQKQSLESQKDDDFDKLIAEIKAKHQDAPEQQKTQQGESPKQVSETTQETQENKGLIQAMQETQKMQTIKPQEKEKQEKVQPQISQDKSENQAPKQPLLQASQSTQALNVKPKEKTPQKISTPKVQETKKAVEKKAEENKKPKEVKSQNNLSASSAFDSLEIPRGFYLQVGVFEKTPNADFLSKLSTFSYRVEKFNNKGKIVNRYLVGPFKTREDAESKILEVMQKITKPVIVEIP